MQNVSCRKETEGERDEEREQTELQTAPSIVRHAAHIQFQRGKEHDVVDAHLSENLERTVALENVKSKGTYQHACQHQSYNGRNAQPPQQQRG